MVLVDLYRYLEPAHDAIAIGSVLVISLVWMSGVGSVIFRRLRGVSYYADRDRDPGRTPVAIFLGFLALAAFLYAAWFGLDAATIRLRTIITTGVIQSVKEQDSSTYAGRKIDKVLLVGTEQPVSVVVDPEDAETALQAGDQIPLVQTSATYYVAASRYGLERRVQEAWIFALSLFLLGCLFAFLSHRVYVRSEWRMVNLRRLKEDASPKTVDEIVDGDWDQTL